MMRFRPMTETISTIEVRQRLGDLLNRVALRHDEFIIERKGKPLAVLVPFERLQRMERFARRQAQDFFEQQKGSLVSEKEADALAVEAKRWARVGVGLGKKPRKARRRA